MTFVCMQVYMSVRVCELMLMHLKKAICISLGTFVAFVDRFRAKFCMNSKLKT